MTKRRDENETRQRIVRKIGEREEVLETQLSADDRAELQAQVMVFLDEKDKLKDKKAEVAKNIGAQIETIELQERELRRQIRSGVRRDTVVVEEHLTAGNEVIRLRKDTGRQIGARNATPRELQEDLPFKPSEAQEPTEAAPEAVASDGFLDAPEEFSEQPA